MNKTGQYITNKENSLSIYFTANYPIKGCTSEIIISLQNAGVDLIEIGIPFSDPLADGPVIQKSSKQALENGFTLNILFNELKTIQSQVKIPLVLMGYFNTVIAYGIEMFLSQCKSLNIDTVIIPDLPPDIYKNTYCKLFKNYGVSPVFLITPQTTKNRIDFINNLSNAFIYAVSDNSITGSTGKFSDNQLLYFKRLKDTSLKVPVMIGFGISDNKAYWQACEFANGVIIGSAFIQKIEKEKDLNETIHNFIHSIKQDIL